MRSLERNHIGGHSEILSHPFPVLRGYHLHLGKLTKLSQLLRREILTSHDYKVKSRPEIIDSMF